MTVLSTQNVARLLSYMSWREMISARLRLREQGFSLMRLCRTLAAISIAVLMLGTPLYASTKDTLYLELYPGYHGAVPSVFSDLPGPQAAHVLAIQGGYFGVLIPKPPDGSEKAEYIKKVAPDDIVNAWTHGTDVLPEGTTDVEVVGLGIWQPKYPPYKFEVRSPSGNLYTLDPPYGDGIDFWYDISTSETNSLGIWIIKVTPKVTSRGTNVSLPRPFIGGRNACLNPDDLNFGDGDGDDIEDNFEHQPLLQVIVLRETSECPQSVYQYAVKCVCGEPDEKALAPGSYFTAINVHNPTADTVVFRKKLASTLPGGEPGLISEFYKSELIPDQALEIDCAEVFEQARQAGFGRDFFKGFVVIESDAELDVVAVYTAAGATGQVETMHVEPVLPRCLGAGCPDLVVDSIMSPILYPNKNLAVIRAIIRNIGNAFAGPTKAQMTAIIPATGASFEDDTPITGLMPGARTTVTFQLTREYHRSMTFQVKADYMNELLECNESNNLKTYEGTD